MNRVCIKQSAIDGVGLIDANYGNFAFRRHYHLEYHIGLIMGGTQRYHCKGSQHHASPGQLVIMPPDLIHDGQGVDNQGYATKVFTLSHQWLANSLGEITGQNELGFTQHLVDDPQLYRGLSHAHHLLTDAKQPALAHDCLPIEMIEQLVSRHGSMTPKRTATLGKRDLSEIRDYMLAHLDQPIRLADLCQLCELTETALTRTFKATTGLPPYAWLTRLRLEKAMEWLRTGRCVTSVAQLVGFYDQAHFSRIFKQQFGLTPGQVCGAHSGIRPSDCI
ncbi:helix-turn-helix transcriptional regulator [Ferrimonas aestuarii]|uniref:helix-turn-helix transcriptional regulator n=1 Tax=Ferrimonas aestuarii TaxID=2569539 RepID=UPI00145E7E54|nr:AraC family transcriptional regulator [Ferrimonas aestuarii]